MLEIAYNVTLCLLGAEEGNGSLGWHGSSGRDLAGGNKNEAVALRFPCEVDDGVLERVDNFYRHALLSNTKDF